jgi:N6-L-threonylcarbamoyladenine synthase
MKILSIETSCDDTCISILEAKGGITNTSFKVLANNTNSQIQIHIPYGGVYPVMAKREHNKNLPILLEASLKEAHLTPTPLLNKERGLGRGIDAIAVTYGPGLEMCLWEGIIFAKELAEKWNVPIIPVNHMEGHVFSVFGKNKGKFIIPKVKAPVLTLLVSGGHTQLVLTKKWMQYEIIGESVDDAVGEAFDKVARMLDLPYPGGPQISAIADIERVKGNQTLFSLPRPMLKSKDFNFSFAGLKTAVLYLIRKIGKLDEETKSKIALEFENAAIECLVYKTYKAIEKYKIKTLIVAGGVACNTHLQEEMKKFLGKKVKLFFPAKGLAGDNSLMIGIAGYLNYIKNKKKVPKPASIKATGSLRL